MSNLADLGSARTASPARTSRAGEGVPPKQSFLKTTLQEKSANARKPSPARETRALPRFTRRAKHRGDISEAYDANGDGGTRFCASGARSEPDWRLSVRLRKTDAHE